MTINPQQQLQQLALLRGTQAPIPQQTQPVQDPRMQALQQYMQMQGAQQMPNLPQQMPNGQGGTRQMTLPENQQAVEDMQQGSDEAYPNDTNEYFQDLDNDMDDQTRSANEQMYAETNTAPMRKPSYVDNKGNPSSLEEYTDEDMINLVGKQIDGTIDFSPTVGTAQQQLIKDPSEANIKAFIEMHGEENLPDELRDPDPDDPADNR